MDKTDFMPIKDIRDRMKNINVMFIVLESAGMTKTKENREIFSFKVADSTACINCSIWDEPGKLLQPGDIVRMMKCYASMFRNCLTLYSGKSGEISRVGDFCMIFNEQLNMSEAISLNQNPAPPPILPALNGTNGNGRILPVNTAVTPPNAANSVPGSTTTSIDSAKPKVPNTNNTNRNYVRRPINKK